MLILDEPTDGLDPNQKHEVRELIRSMAEDKLIVISTHILEEVEAVCSRAIIIAGGRILADDTPANLASQSRYHNAIRLKLDSKDLVDTVGAELGRLASVASTETDREHATVTALPGESAGDAIWREVTACVADKGWATHGVYQQSGHLDEVFRQITRGVAA